MGETKGQRERRLARERQRRWRARQDKLIQAGDQEAVNRRNKAEHSTLFSAARRFIKTYPNLEEFAVLRKDMDKQEQLLKKKEQ